MGPPDLRHRLVAVGLPALAELVGTALVMAVGLSVLTLAVAFPGENNGWLDGSVLRHLVIGLAFAAATVAVVYSPLGRRSGGHLNPSVTLGFAAMGKLHWWGTALYLAAQGIGAILGAAVVATAWGARRAPDPCGRESAGALGWPVAFVAELVFTFLVVSLIFHFVDHPALMRFTPVAAGLAATVVVIVEAPLSSTSLNPARSLGSAILGTTFGWLWIYLLAPPLGGLLAALVFRYASGAVPCAKLVHVDGVRCTFSRCAYQPTGAEPTTL